jgi:fibrillarin-like rRNA methylase
MRIIINGTYYVIEYDGKADKYYISVKSQRNNLIRLHETNDLHEAYEYVIKEAETSITNLKNTIIDYATINRR